MTDNIILNANITLNDKLSILKQWNDTLVVELKQVISQRNALKISNNIDLSESIQAYKQKIETQNNEIQDLLNKNVELKKEMEAMNESIIKL